MHSVLYMCVCFDLEDGETLVQQQRPLSHNWHTASDHSAVDARQ